MLNELAQAILFGVIQGVTEFLPISSSAHIALFESFLSVKMPLSYEMILNLGSLIALIIYFRTFIFENIFSTEKVSIANIKFPRILFFAIIASLPALFVGFIFKDKIEEKSSSLIIIGGMMIIVGVVMFIAEKISQNKTTLNDISLKDALIIGCLQCLAFLRGSSRSGITISTALLLNLKKEEAVKFSFLVGIPTLSLAVLYGLWKFVQEVPDTNSLISMSVGFLASLISSLVSIKFLISFVSKKGFLPFIIYRILVGVVIIVLALR